MVLTIRNELFLLPNIIKIIVTTSMQTDQNLGRKMGGGGLSIKLKSAAILRQYLNDPN